MFSVEINCDIGEGFGRWSVADDAAIMDHVTTVNIACGFHAGDPRIMRDTVARAVDGGLQIGAHVALQDLRGFGRRHIAIDPADLRDDVIYQIGALSAFAGIYGASITHVKPHGMLYNMIQTEPEIAEAVAQAISEVDRNLLWYVLDEKVQPIAQACGVSTVAEGFVDLDYDSRGGLLIERTMRKRDPAEVADRAVRLVTQRRAVAVDGTELVLDRATICLHADAPGALEVIRECRLRLEDAGVRVASLSSSKDGGA